MHSIIMGKTEDTKHIIDHIDRDKLNNTRENLRFATTSQNNQNIIRNKDRQIYRGISWNKTTKKWRARSSDVWLGTFENPEDAARTYDTYTILKYGKDSLINGLVEYNDVKDIDIETLLRKRDIPKYIRFNKCGYETKINYKNKTFWAWSSTIEEAENKLKKIQLQIEAIKLKEKEEHDNKEITKDEYGNAIIYAKDKNKKIVDYFIVDSDIWHKCMKFSWWKTGNYYTTKINGKNTLIHYFVLGLEETDLVDHIDRNPKNNKIENLRLVTRSQNGHNRTKQKNASSNYNGVSFHKASNKWAAQIKKDETKYYLGLYSTEKEKEAAIAYNEKAKELYGTFANLNIII